MSGRKSLVVVTSVATVLAAAVVAAPVADAAKAKAPGKVSSVRVSAVVTNAATVSWKNPKSKNFKGVVVRIAAGNKAPKSASSGTAVATVAKSKRAVRIARLKPNTVYTVALFSWGGGKLFSKAASVRIRTKAMPKPKPPAPKPTTGTVAVTVYGGDTTRKLAGANVYLQASNTNDEAYGTTGSSSTYSFAKVRPGPYSVCADSSSTNGSPAGYRYGCAAADVSVAAGKTASVTVTLRRAWGFTGTVTDGSGNAVGDVNVSVLDQDGDDVADDVSTDENGAYKTIAAYGQPTQVCFASGSDSGSAEFGLAAKCVDVEPAAGDLTKLDVQLAAAGAIGGTVSGSDGDGTIPLEQVQVQAIPVDGGDTQQTSSDADGAYRVDRLAGGASYFICFDASSVDPDVTQVPLGYVAACKTADGVTPWSGDTGDIPDAAQAFTATGGQVASLSTSVLQPGGGVAGTVHTSDSVFSNVSVELYSSAKNYLTSAEVNEDGTYQLRSLRSGTYFVCFNSYGSASDEDLGHLSECYNDKPWSGNSDLPSGLTPITVSSGVNTSGVDATLTTGGAIDGAVATADGTAFTGRVAAYDNNGVRVSSDYLSDGDTGFHLAGLATGNYRVCVYAYDNHASRCYSGKAWDGDSSNIPSGTKQISVTAGSAVTGIKETLPLA